MTEKKFDHNLSLSLGFAKIVLSRILNHYDKSKLPAIEDISNAEQCLEFFESLEDTFEKKYFSNNLWKILFDSEAGTAFSDTEFDTSEIVERQTGLTKQLSEGIHRDLRQFRKERASLQKSLSSELINRPVGSNKNWLELVKIAGKLAVTDLPVLITGETGTGKEVLARFIHDNSLRKNGPFVPINCGALPENLVESELYGYVKGSYTSALPKDKMGRLEAATGGTALLDEIDSLSFNSQATLLRFLESGEIQKIGSTKNLKINTRVIVTSNSDLMDLVKRKLFRPDLFYRLNIVPLHIPPLRERKDDIPVFTYHFLKRIVQDYGIQDSRTISNDAMKKITDYDYPGNLRELQSVMSRALIIDEDKHITPDEIVFDKISGSLKPEPEYTDDQLHFIQKRLNTLSFSRNEAHKIADLLIRHKDLYITNKIYTKEFGLSSATVRSRLKSLCDLGLLIHSGSKKGSRYLVAIDRESE